MAATWSLRLAEPHEIADAIAIDDDASRLYTQEGVELAHLTPTTPFIVAEQARWLESIRRGRLFLAVDEGDRALGFAALDVVDGAPYLDQLSVRVAAMRRGIGRALLRRAIAWAREQGAGALWLTTYDHLSWNRPFYEREGFQVVPETEWGSGIAHHVAEQRRWLPLPDERVAMRRAIETAAAPPTG